MDGRVYGGAHFIYMQPGVERGLTYLASDHTADGECRKRRCIDDTVRCETGLVWRL